jgi:release factor glutamine methyltransferase
MNLKQTQHYLQQTLERAGIESAQAESKLLLEALGFSSIDLIVNGTLELSAEQTARLLAWIERRKSREPLQHILGYAYFYGLKFIVTPDVLIPRPETERLVELALELVKDSLQPNILDIATGSGAIALALKHERPDATLMATDISAKALEVARRNAKDHQLEIVFIESDLIDHPKVKVFAQQAHLIVANLPYLPIGDKTTVSTEVLHDPELALYSGEDGLEHFKRLIDACKVLENPTLLLELDPRNSQEAYDYCKGWQERLILADLTGRKRFLQLSLTLPS